MLVPFRTTTASGRLIRSVTDEDGFTLIELLVASALSIVVLTAILSMLISSQNVQARDNEWAQMIQEARTSLATMTHELRQAYRIKIEETNHSKITFNTTIANAEWAVEYNCAVPDPGTEYNECTRKAAELTTGESTGEVSKALEEAKAEPVIRNVLNGTKADEPNNKPDPIFQEFSPNEIAPDLVTIRLVVPAGGTLKLAGAEVFKHKIVLYEGAYIRDMALGA